MSGLSDFKLNVLAGILRFFFDWYLFVGFRNLKVTFFVNMVKMLNDYGGSPDKCWCCSLLFMLEMFQAEELAEEGRR